MGKVGIQLYSIRELTQKIFRNYSGSRKIGYDGVEFAGFLIHLLKM